MKHLFCTLIILINTLYVVAQKDYYATDSTMKAGVKMLDQGIENFQQCALSNHKGITRFTPYEVVEYKTENMVFVARDIIVNDAERRVFLEVLTRGDNTLYFYRDNQIRLFFLEDSTGFYTLYPKNHPEEPSYKEVLQNITADHTPSVGNLYNLPFRRAAMREYIDRYNEKDQRLMQFVRYGLYFGLNHASLSLPANSIFLAGENSSFTNNSWYFAGIFMEMPIKYNNISILLSADISRISGYFTSISIYEEVDILHKSTSVNAPLMIRYTLKRHLLSPYVNTGASFWYDLSNTSTVFRARISPNEISFDPPAIMPLSHNMGIGFLVGAGLDIKISRAHSLLIELRFNRQDVFMDPESNALHFNKTGTQIYAGISF
jgi:hypothetical protein